MRMRNKANQLWHTDSSFKSVPALTSVLAARTIPAAGGETEFASTRLAFERLDAGDAERNWKTPSPGIHYEPFARQDRARSCHPESSRRCRRCAGAWCGAIRSMAAARSTSPRTLMRSKAWKPKTTVKQFIEELTEAATAPGTHLRAQMAQWRCDHVGQPRHHASRPAMARQRAALHGAHHGLGDGGGRCRTDAAAAAARGRVSAATRC